MNEQIVIDAAESVLGRLASYAAKQSLLGKKVVIVNCNDTLIVGKIAVILSKYKQAVARGGSAQKGPNFPRSPERVVKRTIRGMLSHRQGRGRDALKRIICYNSLPADYEKAEKISLARTLRFKAVKLSKISKLL